jgi:hypothetical protein
MAVAAPVEHVDGPDLERAERESAAQPVDGGLVLVVDDVAERTAEDVLSALGQQTAGGGVEVDDLEELGAPEDRDSLASGDRGGDSVEVRRRVDRR